VSRRRRRGRRPADADPLHKAQLRKARAIASKQGWDPAWIRDRQDVAAVLEGGCEFSPEAAQHAIDFFKYLRHSKGEWAGQPFTLLDWQLDFTMRLFGWQRPDGTRRYRRAGLWVPKKNGKSTYAAAVELYLLVGDGEPGAEVYIAANDKGQAGIIYREAESMVRQSPDLIKRIQPVPSRKTMAYPGMRALLQALSADVKTKEGLNASAVVVDELHAMVARALWDALAYSGAARRQPLFLSVSTAGVYDETSIGWEQWEYARQVKDCTLIDWSFLAVIYAADPNDDWRDERTWKKANPSYGVTIKPEAFREECREAQLSPAKQSAFRRYRLNQWVQQANPAIDLTLWDRGRGHLAPLATDALRGRVCDVGLDLASVSDLNVAAYVFEGCADQPDALDVFLRCWVPQGALENEKNPNKELYQQWVRDGWIEVMPGRVADYDFILQRMLDDAGVFAIRDVNIDHLFQGQQLAVKLEQEGFQVYPMRQGFLSFGPAYREFERVMEAERLHHAMHPVLRWCAENALVAQDPAGNKKIVKPKGRKKVDALVAVVMALERWSRHVEHEGESVYDKGEPLGL
jgi:phage terminase large subunit-like protein